MRGGVSGSRFSVSSVVWFPGLSVVSADMSPLILDMDMIPLCDLLGKTWNVHPLRFGDI